MSLTERVISKFRRDGLMSLIKTVPNVVDVSVVRLLFPARRHALWNGVEVPPEVADYRRVLDGYLLAGTDYERSEGGEVECHKIYTSSGDKVVIIGGGRGVTTVHAAWESEPDGQVTVFEASKRYLNVILEVTELNDVSTSCNVRHALVGPDINVFGDEGPGGAETIPVDGLPECDILEMDCEGAELDIIGELEIRPRVIIVELHPRKYSAKRGAVVDELSRMGYDICERRTNEGEPLTQLEFRKVLEKNSRSKAPSPVVAAIIN